LANTKLLTNLSETFGKYKIVSKHLKLLVNVGPMKWFECLNLSWNQRWKYTLDILV